MKKIFLLLFASVAFIQSNAQRPTDEFGFHALRENLKTDFNSDSISKNFLETKDHTIDSIFSISKNYDFEFRFWQQGSISNSSLAFIITYANKKWSARLFQSGTVSVGFVEVTPGRNNIEKLWDLLCRQHVLSLPAMISLKNRMVNYVVDTAFLGDGQQQTLDVTDGTLYQFELHAPGKSRFYNYSNPQLYFNKYSNIEELYDAVEIILLIKKYLHLPLEA